MTAGWVVYLLVAGILLALGARAASSALAIAGWSTRWASAAALAGLLLLGAVAPRARSFELATTSLTPASMISVQSAPSRSGIGAFVDAVRGAMETTVTRAIATASGGVPAPAARVLAIAWSLASGVLLLVYLVVNLRVARARRHWPRERLHGLDVRVAPSAGPAVIGVVRAEIVVPRALLERSVEEQRLILAHEHEHLRARDNVLLGLACAVVIVLPWHPAAWYLLARLRLAIELDCDARVLRGGAAPRSYGALLIDMAAHGAGMRIGTLALADRPTHLERRLLAMRSHRSRYALVRGGVSCAVAGLLVLAACEAKMPTSAELSTMGVGDMQKTAARTGAFSDSRFANADFFLDGVKTSQEEVMKLEASRIGSMEVVKGVRDTIFVTSRERLARAKSVGRDGTKLRAESSFARVSVPELLGSKGAQPAFIIDGVLADAAAVAALRPEYIRSVHVVKAAAADSRYPNGLIELETGTTALPMKERVPAPTKERVPAPTSLRRTDTIVVRDASGEARASKMWGWAASTVSKSGSAQNTVVMPNSEPEPRKVPLEIGGTITPTGERVPASRSTQDSAPRRQLKDYAITIDGVPATKAELAQLPEGEAVGATMWVLDGDKRSSDPRAVNGLLEVTTRKAMKKN